MTSGSGTADSGATALKRAAIAIVVFLVLAGLLFLFGPDDVNPWANAIPVSAVIAWRAGMLYRPRLFVYHAAAATGSLQSEPFKV
ncbi:MAG: CopD family protein, partial [Mesorhizobium sp.]